MKRQIKIKGSRLPLLGFFILAFITILSLLYYSEANSRNDSENGYANRTLCYSHLMFALRDVQGKTISSSPDFQETWEPSRFTKYFCCPVSGGKYLFNPALISWPDDNEIVIVCPSIHPIEERQSNKYLAITFGGNLTTVSLLPKWAETLIENGKKGGK